ncbi:hypothetical protein C8R45DRAFT_480302 [Mycena sanguinolenta]|nr:hypothetical protein C8R45DRAFT_480302 [Mycena sanguinolenta]
MDEEAKRETTILNFFCPDMPSFARVFDHSSLEQLRDDIRQKLHLVTNFFLSYKVGDHEFMLEDDKDFDVFELKANTASLIPIYIRITDAAGASAASTISAAAGHQRPNSKSPLVVRTQLLEYLYETGLNLQYFLIEGTPGSGKTTLCAQLFDYISVRDPDAPVTMIDGYGWQDGIRLADRLEACYSRGTRITRPFEHQPTWHWVLFDEPSTISGDPTLWSSFAQGASDKNFILIFFTSYWDNEPKPLDVVGTPDMFRLHEPMGMRPTEHGLDASHIPGLFFLEAEYEELVIRQQKYAGLPVLAQDLKLWAIKISAGHIGAIESIFEAIKAKTKELRLPQIDLSTFMASFRNPNEAIEVCSLGRAFARGLPGYWDLRNEEGHISAALKFCRGLIGATKPLELDLNAIPEGALEYAVQIV